LPNIQVTQKDPVILPKVEPESNPESSFTEDIKFADKAPVT